MTSLSLRRLTYDDDALLFELDNDSDVMRYINGGEPVSLPEIQQVLLPRFVEERELGFWAIEVAGDTAGWVSLRLKPGSDRAELGYRLKPRYWGQGVATLAARNVLERGFAAGYATIFATTYEQNLGSIRVMEKLGMSLVRKFRWDGNASDTALSAGDSWDGMDVEYAIAAAQFDSGGTN